VPRVTQIRSKDDFPHELSDSDEKELTEIFPHFSRYMANCLPGIYGDGDTPNVGISNSWSQMAHDPRLANLMIDLSDHVLNDMPWSKLVRQRELAILAIYQRQRCDYGYRAHLFAGAEADITPEMVADLPVYHTSSLFTEEERTVIEYTHAVIDGLVSDELFERAKGYYGERGMVELTMVVAYWAHWGMLINALQPDFALIK
jgi:alkylhydroperoxidase family enzyme